MNNQFKSIFITPNNVRDLASTLHKSTVIQARAIQFGPVSAEGTTLLEVPILSPGEAGPQTTIRITVGLDAAASISGGDHDPDVGITMVPIIIDSACMILQTLALSLSVMQWMHKQNIHLAVVVLVLTNLPLSLPHTTSMELATLHRTPDM